MTLKHFFAYLLFISALTSASVANADDVAVTQRLVRATDASSLDSLTTKPWHAKLAVTVFDAKGKNPVEGTVEHWKAGEDWLRITTIGSTTETLLRHDGHSYRSEGSSDVPYLATAALDEFLHPGPTQNEIEASKPELRKQNFGKVSLDCIMLSQPLKRVAFAPLGLFPTYCLDPGADRLRVSYDFGSLQVTINRAGRFLNHDVAVEFSLSEGAVVVATAKLVSLTTFTPTPEMFQPAAQLKPVLDTVLISSGVIQGYVLNKVQPVYPQEARTNHVSGTVVMRAIIGRDGHIHLLQVKSAPDPDLAIASLAAVRQWTYKPYLLNGEPTEVDTTVIVNFNFNPY